MNGPRTTQRGRRPARVQAFLDQAVALDSDECLLWPWGSDRKGYGKLYHAGHHTHVHRVVYLLAHGAIPEGHHVDHRCFNPPCANPRHLEAVSPRENVRRQRSTKLTADTASAIRNEWHARRQRRGGRLARGELAAMAVAYGVSFRTVLDVARGRSWAE